MRAIPLLTLVLLFACGRTVDPEPDGKAGSGATSPSAGTAADGGLHPTDAPLCDGSDEIRFMYESAGGHVDDAYGFTNPYGHAFLFVDGSCRYFAGDNYMRGIASGTLTQAEADELSKDVHWRELDAWTWGVVGEFSCPDAGSVTLNKARVSASCSCGCDKGAPKGLEAALAKGYEWVERLVSEGAPLEGPISAVALEASAGVSDPPSAWPLTKTLSSIPNLIVERGDAKLWMGTGPWARFDDAADAAKLRELRTTLSKTDRPGSGSVHTFVQVQEGSNVFELYVRDELPDGVVKALAELKATLPK
jgi:hypothetical protein